MTRIKQVMPDIVKPHHPDVPGFAQSLTRQRPDYKVEIDVRAAHEKTETLLINAETRNIDHTTIADEITSMGGSTNARAASRSSSQPSTASHPVHRHADCRSEFVSGSGNAREER